MTRGSASDFYGCADGRDMDGTVGRGIWAVVLAAGLSRRMQWVGQSVCIGEPPRLKPLLPMPDGRPMIRWVVDAALTSQVNGVIVVVPSGSAAQDFVKVCADCSAVCVENPCFELGQSTSLQIGIEALQERHAAAGVVLLADQPEISPGAIDAVVTSYLADGKPPVVQANYLDGPGHPVLFDNSLFPELMKVEGDEGGRSVVRHHALRRVLAPFDANAPVDIDTREAYDALWERLTH